MRPLQSIPKDPAICWTPHSAHAMVKAHFQSTFLSLPLCLCLYGSMIFLLLFIVIISSFVRSLSDFNRVGIHRQLGHPKRQGIRSWQRINCMCRKLFYVCFLLGNYSNCMFLLLKKLLNLFVLSHLLYYEQFLYTPLS